MSKPLVSPIVRNLQDWFNQLVSEVKFVHWPILGNPNVVDYEITFDGPRPESPEIFTVKKAVFRVTFTGDNEFTIENTERLD